MSFQVKYEHRQNDIYTWDHVHNPRLHYSTPHIHKDLEIVFYEDGKTEAIADSVSYSLSAGDVFITFPNQIHSYKTLVPERYRLFLIKPDYLPELAHVFELSAPSSNLVKGAALEPRLKQAAEALAEICKSSEDSPYRQTLLKGYCLALLSELLSRMTVGEAPKTDSDALRSIIYYCTKNYNRDISLSTLEEQLHLNKYYISHLFSGKLGLRFNDYINSLRISEACRRLLNTDESITSISDRVGFNTLRTFNRAFMKQMKISPSEYRRQNRRLLLQESDAQ